MNANATTGIRELTALEMDEVAGGLTYQEAVEYGQMGVIGGIAFVVGAGIGALLDWLFG
jgi:hypothetical protein